jgi:hypothetical protein
VDFVRALGWKKVDERAGRASWWRPPTDEETELVVPLSKELGDYYLRASDAVTLLSEVDRTSPVAIVNAIHARFEDVLKVRLHRADHADADGTVPLARGAQAVMRIAEIIEAAAAATVFPAPIFARTPDEARHFLSEARLGQTEVGSYVITVHSRLPAQLDLEAVSKDEVPFQRQVFKTLASSLAAAKDAVTAAQRDDAFLAAVQRGVSANLCDALSWFGVGEELEAVEFNVTWATAEPGPPELSRQIEFRRPSFRVLDAAAKFLAKVEPEPDFTLVGPVRRLEKEDPTLMDEPGSIFVVATIHGEQRLVAVRLRTDEYVQAIQAHAQGRSVSIVGTLRAYGNKLRLENPQHFKVL